MKSLELHPDSNVGLIENQKLQEDELNKAMPRHSWLEKRIQMP
jgi:hypothetical protein